MKLSAAVLSGGASSRMGRDKAWVEVDGRPLIVRSLEMLSSLGLDEILISGRRGTDYSAFGLPVLFDARPGCGPLGGIERALDAAVYPMVLILAVDLPLMTSTFLRKLTSHCHGLTGAIPMLNGRLEPLAAVYPKRCLLTARNCLAESRIAARHFGQICVSEGALRIYEVQPVDSQCFVNCNSPSDLPDQRNVT